VETQFKKVIEPYLKKDCKLLLACSGGADSVALFYLLKNAGVNFELAHVNYQLRGEESNKDALFVKNLCENFAVPFHLKEVEIKTQTKSIQEEARNIRYHFFETLKTQHGFDYIVTAHHAGDKIENILFRFFRGTGLKGLLSLNILDNNIFRPLIAFNKEDILAFLKKHNYTFREDASNAANKYTRNKIRNTVIPILEKDLPQLEKRIAHTAAMLQNDYSLIKTLLQNDQRLLEKSGSFNFTCSQTKFHEPAYWFYLLSDFNITPEEAKNIAFACQSNSNGFQLVLDARTISIIKNKVIIHTNATNNFVLVEAINATTTQVDLGTVTLWLSYVDGNKIIRRHNTLCLNADQLHFPLSLRHPQKGDKFSPLGLEGNKLLSDFYNELGIVASQKSKQWLLLDAHKKIIASIPHRIDNAVKVYKETKRILVISMEVK